MTSNTVKTDANLLTIYLDTPILRQGSDESISSIELRKPLAGELRGINLTDIVQLEVGALIKLLPRICTPDIHEHEWHQLDIADLLQIGMQVVSFFIQKSSKVTQ